MATERQIKMFTALLHRKAEKDGRDYADVRAEAKKRFSYSNLSNLEISEISEMIEAMQEELEGGTGRESNPFLINPFFGERAQKELGKITEKQGRPQEKIITEDEKAQKTELKEEFVGIRGDCIASEPKAENRENMEQRDNKDNKDNKDDDIDTRIHRYVDILARVTEEIEKEHRIPGEEKGYAVKFVFDAVSRDLRSELIAELRKEEGVEPLL